MHRKKIERVRPKLGILKIQEAKLAIDNHQLTVENLLQPLF